MRHVILCSRCRHPEPAPERSQQIQCQRCGNRMNVVNIQPAAQAARATWEARRG